MELIFERFIYLKDEYENYQKVCSFVEEPDFIPRVSDKVTFEAFGVEENVGVAEVDFDYEFDQCTVTLEALEIESTHKKDLKEVLEFYMDHGWDCRYYALLEI